ncbi:Aspartic peptidase domain superfamily [Fusarium oxysporum f. sp. vasinfectum]|uniref:Uncharacterized protein n=1 Tax=Fusarium oxysporum f. sp. vasinfectum 25433 TaxID=1089449 RepID=X0LK39_FUSOX|nr:hypothetical protein FOTG_10898 [Fusarium oxysporum f. sp. vasinfectum 25433]KAK2924527.1 Aspartic peptidase domain superfamily [Fusarium oxysporum f. sp. vasinfectum]
MLISTSFAIRHSLEIDRNSENRHIIEYADGSLDTTAGIVHGATWQFRSSWDKVTCDFYVLDNLKADIVLSSQFVFEHNVFSEFEEDTVDTSLVPGPDFGDIYNIRLISHYSSALQNLEASAIADMNSPSSFSPEAIKNERVRRDQIRDAIRFGTRSLLFPWTNRTRLALTRETGKKYGTATAEGILKWKGGLSLSLSRLWLIGNNGGGGIDHFGAG